MTTVSMCAGFLSKKRKGTESCANKSTIFAVSTHIYRAFRTHELTHSSFGTCLSFAYSTDAATCRPIRQLLQSLLFLKRCVRQDARGRGCRKESRYEPFKHTSRFILGFVLIAWAP